MHHKTDTPKVGIDYSIPGMRIERFNPDNSWALVVRCAAPKPEWILEPTTLTERISVKEVPTTIMYREAAYRIHEVEEKNESWIYRMRRWPDGEPRIRTFDLSRGAIEEDAKEKNEIKKETALTSFSAYYDCALGWLPAEVQEKLSERMHFNPKEASLKNAWLECLFGLSACAHSIAFMFASFYGGGGQYLSNSLILFLIALEGFIRWGHVTTSGKPLGLFLLEGCVFVASGARKIIAQVRSRLKN